MKPLIVLTRCLKNQGGILANPISKNMKIGLIGELLVELRFLQYGIQSSKPRSDSGNDLIISIPSGFYTVQIKSTIKGRFSYPKEETKFDFLALVKLKAIGDNEVLFDESTLYLIHKEDIIDFKRSKSRDGFLFSELFVENLFNL